MLDRIRVPGPAGRIRVDRVSTRLVMAEGSGGVRRVAPAAVPGGFQGLSAMWFFCVLFPA
ncbi:hypothetical protein ACQPZF_02400 [Actinosynnema sp. CS-041913]|uniref:hypothetical protein n=1 Tax=Actinosynnema sp. CS-041913 TaxID=3239917 RepID=UPI003D908E41